LPCLPPQLRAVSMPLARPPASSIERPPSGTARIAAGPPPEPQDARSAAGDTPARKPDRLPRLRALVRRCGTTCNVIGYMGASEDTVSRKMPALSGIRVRKEQITMRPADHPSCRARRHPRPDLPARAPARPVRMRNGSTHPLPAESTPDGPRSDLGGQLGKAPARPAKMRDPLPGACFPLPDRIDA
jgi:hypothetical protein